MKNSHTLSPLPAGWRARVRLSTAFFSLILLCAAPVAAQDDLPYDSGSTGADGPLIVPNHVGYRENAEGAYDAARGETVLFGGHWSSTYYTETWIYDGEEWSTRSHPTFVSGRRYHAMTYDPVGERVILFGGQRADGTLLNDMWAWNGTDWTELNPQNRPPVREHPSMAADPATGNILLFGGNGDNDDPDDGIQTIQRNDTWLYDRATGNWTKLDPATKPDSRYASYRKMVFHEGLGEWFMYNEWTLKTWSFDGTDWLERPSTAKPNVGERFGMVYDVANNEVVLHDGSSLTRETWTWSGGEWILEGSGLGPWRQRGHVMVYDSDLELTYTINGWQDSAGVAHSNGNPTTTPNYNTWAWDGDSWTYLIGLYYYFNMDEKPDGVWNFTSIHVPAGIEVRFRRNAANTPVRWLATESVTIDGTLRMDGQDAKSNNADGDFAIGGPGGSSGGLGGIRFDVSGSYAGTPGQGAGGGAPGTTENEYGQDGRFNNVYGNSLLQPLVGGSGGGGGGSRGSVNGGHGAGGGGAIYIASSRDITINGQINADGGRRTWSGASYGGIGSGGAIRLVADRVLGSGNLYARGGRSSTDETGGRIRIEAYFRPLAARTSPVPSATAPVIDIIQGAEPVLSVVSIDGADVNQPPTGDPRTPDVIFTAGETVEIVVQGVNIPAGTPVTIRISSSGQILDLPATGEPDVTLGEDGLTTFSTVVPAGVGTVQAFAEFDAQ